MHELVLTLISSTRIKIVAVGDPDQSIYGFNGATPEYFFELEESGNFEVVHLKNNYRSHQMILDASVSILGYPANTYKALKKFDDSPEINLVSCKMGIESQYEYIVNDIVNECLHKGIPYSEISVLAKSKSQVQELKK